VLVRIAGLGVLLAVLLLLASGHGQAASAAAQTGEPEEAYTRLCAACHGVLGEGSAFGPGLIGSQMDDDERIAIIADGSSAMPAFGPTLTPAQIDDLAFYIASLGSPATAGSAVYAESCATCHGADGHGGAGPNLSTEALPRDDLMDVVTEGKGTMPGFGDQLSVAELEAVVTFVEELAAAPPDTSEPSLVAIGADLFSANCVRCHGQDASGGFGPALKYSPLTDVELVSVVNNGRGNMPSFSEILSSSDTTALVAYLASTRSTNGDADPPSAIALGRDVFVTSCATCHGLDGTGGVAPSLANTRLTANEIISRVFGIHADRMPAFEGLLDATQVQEVSRYVLTIEGKPRSQTGWIVAGGLAVLGVITAVVFWYFRLPERLLRRSG
jgi:mono/diheme cytochrome c family protein